MFFDTTIDTDLGYAASAFHWSIGSDAGPHIISELQWKKLHGPYGRFLARAEWNDLLFAFIELEGMWATSGYVTDSDFEKEGRNGMSERSICKASGSKEGSIRGGIGASLYFYHRTLKFDFSCGYRFAAQWLKMHTGEVIESIYSELGPIAGLSNRYNAYWKGFDTDFTLTRREGPISAFLNLNFFFPFYSAEGHWNLRTDFLDPFEQTASDAFGVTVRAGLLYYFDCWSLGLTYQCQYFSAYHGKDKWSALDGFGNITTGAGRLNEAILTTSSYTIRVGFVF